MINGDNEDGLDIPDFLKIPAERRRAAWKDVPMPQVKTTARPALPINREEDESSKEAKRARAKVRRELRRERSIDRTGQRWDPVKAKWIIIAEDEERRRMEALEEMSGPQLANYYNALAAKVGAKPVKLFKNRTIGIARCIKMDAVAKARDAGVVLPAPTDSSDVAEQDKPTEDQKERIVAKKRSTSAKKSSGNKKSGERQALTDELIELLKSKFMSLKEVAKALYGSASNESAAAGLVGALRTKVNKKEEGFKSYEMRKERQEGVTRYKLVRA
jgi:hypothetical protein